MDDQNFKKGGDIKKREDQIFRRESTCFFGSGGGRRGGSSVSLLKPSFETHFSFCI